MIISMGIINSEVSRIEVVSNMAMLRLNKILWLLVQAHPDA